MKQRAERTFQETKKYNMRIAIISYVVGSVFLLISMFFNYKWVIDESDRWEYPTFVTMLVGGVILYYGLSKGSCADMFDLYDAHTELWERNIALESACIMIDFICVHQETNEKYRRAIRVDQILDAIEKCENQATILILKGSKGLFRKPNYTVVAEDFETVNQKIVEAREQWKNVTHLIVRTINPVPCYDCMTGERY